VDMTLELEPSHCQARPTIVWVAGEVDNMSARRLRACLDVAIGYGSPVVVDLERVSFVDGAGIKVLVATRKRSGELGTSFTLRRPSRAVNRVLEIAGVRDLIEVEPTSLQQPLTTTQSHR